MPNTVPLSSPASLDLRGFRFQRRMLWGAKYESVKCSGEQSVRQLLKRVSARSAYLDLILFFQGWPNQRKPVHRV